MMYKGPIKKSGEDLSPCRCEKKICYLKDRFIENNFQCNGNSAVMLELEECRLQGVRKLAVNANVSG